MKAYLPGSLILSTYSDAAFGQLLNAIPSLALLQAKRSASLACPHFIVIAEEVRCPRALRSATKVANPKSNMPISLSVEVNYAHAM